MLGTYNVVTSVFSCTTVVGSKVTVTGAGVTRTVEGSSVTVDGANVSVVRITLFSTTVTGGGVTYMVLQGKVSAPFDADFGTQEFASKALPGRGVETQHSLFSR